MVTENIKLMVDYDLDDMFGVMFPNQKKVTKKHPEFNGQLMIEGKRYNVGLWISKTKDEQPIYKLKLSIRL